MKLPRQLPARLPVICFAVLAVATAGAFYLVQHLKVANPLYNGSPRADPAVINPRRGGVCVDAAGDRVSFRSSRIGFYLQSKSDVVDVNVVNSDDEIVAQMSGSGRYLHVGTGANPTYSYFGWDGRTSSGAYAPAGVYTLRLYLKHQDRDEPINGQTITVSYAAPRPRITGVSVAGATTAGGTPSFTPERQSATIHFRGVSGLGASVLVFRASTAGRLRLVTRFGVSPRADVATWNGLIAGRPAPAGSYLIGLSVLNDACTSGQFPPIDDPAPGSTDGAGVNVAYLAATPPLTPTPAGQPASVGVQAGGADYAWALRRVGTAKVLAHGSASTGTLRVRMPGIGLYDLRLRTGRYSTAVPLVASGTGRRAAARVLVVLPALSWQGANPVDGSSDGLADTLSAGGTVGLGRPLVDGLPADVANEAGLLATLDADHLSYDLTTDVGLAEGIGPDLVGDSGIVLDGTFTWLPSQLYNPLRAFVQAGGGAFAAGTGSLGSVAAISGSGADAVAGPAHGVGEDPFEVQHGTVSPSYGQIIAEFTDRLGIFSTAAALQYPRYQVLQPVGGRVDTVAGVSEAAPAVIGFGLGKGTVVEAGLPDFGSSLAGDVDARELLGRVWQVVLR